MRGYHLFINIRKDRQSKMFKTDKTVAPPVVQEEVVLPPHVENILAQMETVQPEPMAPMVSEEIFIAPTVEIPQPPAEKHWNDMTFFERLKSRWFA